MNNSAKKERKIRDWSGLLPFALIMMLISAAIGLVASVIDISENSKTRLLNDYVASTVTFSVVGYGEYQEKSPAIDVEFYVPVVDNTAATLLEGKFSAVSIKDSTTVYTFENADTTLLGDLIAMAEENADYSYSIKYKQKDKVTSVTTAYDAAYDEAMSKATLIAENTGKQWRITEVEEVNTSFDSSTGKTISEVRMSFAVSDN